MKNEFYEYICPSKRITQKAIQTNTNTSKKEDLMGYIATFFILLVFSLPMAISQVWLWSMVIVGYIILLLICKLDKDPYSKTILFFGSTTLYLCVVLSYLIITESYKKFQISSFFTLFILTIFCVAFYEILILANILLKRYTARMTNKKSYPTIYTSIGTFCGGIIGYLIARRISPYLEKSLWSIWLILIACSLLFTISLSFFQKYILYKILYKSINKSRNLCEDTPGDGSMS